MVRRIQFEFEDMEDGTTLCSAMGTAFKWDDLIAISEFALNLMESYNRQCKKCNDAKYGKKEEN